MILPNTSLITKKAYGLPLNIVTFGWTSKENEEVNCLNTLFTMIVFYFVFELQHTKAQRFNTIQI